MVAIIGPIHLGAQKSNASTVTLPVQTLESLELTDGDLVFRAGRDMMARLVLSQGESSRFSHVGVIIKQNSDLFVVHALPHDQSAQEGVLIEPLALFASTDNAADIGFYRVKRIEAISRQKIRSYALHQVGKPFDQEFRFSDDANVYCTELALKALAAGGIDILKTIHHVSIMTLTEPIYPPDYLRRSVMLEEITPNPLFQGTRRNKAAARP